MEPLTEAQLAELDALICWLEKNERGTQVKVGISEKVLAFLEEIMGDMWDCTMVQEFTKMPVTTFMKLFRSWYDEIARENAEQDAEVEDERGHDAPQ